MRPKLQNRQAKQQITELTEEEGFTLTNAAQNKTYTHNGFSIIDLIFHCRNEPKLQSITTTTVSIGIPIGKDLPVRAKFQITAINKETKWTVMDPKKIQSRHANTEHKHRRNSIQ